MNPSGDRIQQLVETLQLTPHPEGGFYSETFRSTQEVPHPNGEKRQLATSIYFLLRSQDVSHFHRIQSDELWFWHEGSPLSIHLLGEGGHEILRLGPVSRIGTRSQHLVPAKTIFGSTVDEQDTYTLVSCVVAPGFDFRDFELFTAEDLVLLFPDAEEIILKLT
jgi:predicted cupin superfamily sugar epimerase